MAQTLELGRDLDASRVACRSLNFTRFTVCIWNATFLPHPLDAIEVLPLIGLSMRMTTTRLCDNTDFWGDSLVFQLSFHHFMSNTTLFPDFMRRCTSPAMVRLSHINWLT